MITKITNYVKKKIPNVEIQDSVTTNSKYLWLNESSKVRISDHFSSKKPVLNIIIPETQGYFVIIMGYRTHISKSFRETCETIVTFLKLNEGIEEKLKNQSKTITELTTNLETAAIELATLKKEIVENQKVIRNLENQVSNFKVSKAQFDRIKDDLTNKKNALSTAENTIKNCENNSQILRDALNTKIAENQKLSDDLKEAASLIEELTTSQELRDMFYNKHSGKKYYLDNFPIEMQGLIQDLIKNYYKLMNEVINWLKRGSEFKRVEGDFKTIPTIPTGVYNVGLSLSGWYLEKYADSFTFDYKIYGLQEDFLDHIIKTYQNTRGNFGILFNGIKGSGKTVAAKILANRLQLPVIIVKSMGDQNQNMIEYLSSFNFDCVIFMDEFEKNFTESDSTVLQIMDGVYNIGYRKVFLLTTNSLSVNENLIGRPSRIRYVRKFINLSLSTVEEYLDDNLQNLEYKKDLMEYVDTLSISTIDILKTIVEEVNIHGLDGFEKAKTFFNVDTLQYNYYGVYSYVRQSMVENEPEKWSITQFLKDVDKYYNPPIRPAFMINKEEDEWTTEEILEAKEYNENRRRIFDISYENWELNKKIVNLKVGDDFDGKTVVAIDMSRKVMCCLENNSDDEPYYLFYYIKNPLAKPSLYGKPRVGFDLVM